MRCILRRSQSQERRSHGREPDPHPRSGGGDRRRRWRGQGRAHALRLSRPVSIHWTPSVKRGAALPPPPCFTLLIQIVNIALSGMLSICIIILQLDNLAFLFIMIAFSFMLYT